MHARNRSAIVVIIIALVCFIARWPLDNDTCNPKTWHSTSVRDKHHRLMAWRESSRTGTGDDIWSVVLQGGGGTPAMFAMLGGQRDLVANILWNYADVLFHQGKPYDMVKPFESCVTLNPSFLEAWSTYGWHLAWNLNAETQNIPEKAKWMRDGEKVYLRAVDANPDKPKPFFDLAWLYLQRKGDYLEALAPLKYVVDNFQPITPEERKQHQATDPVLETKWDPRIYGLRLAYVYKLLGIVSEDKSYFDKSLAIYKRCIQLDPESKDAQRLYKDMAKHRDDSVWLKKQQATMEQIRRNFAMNDINFGKAPKLIFEQNPEEGTYLGTSDH